MQIEKVAQEHGQALAPLTDDLALIDSGLDSLAVAVLIVRLETKFGVDPFSGPEDIAFPITLRDLVAVYETATKTAST
jgi:hypothetical protein